MIDEAVIEEDSNDQGKSELAQQLVKQQQDNKDMQLLIEVLQDKVKRLEGKGKMEEEERVEGGDQHPPPQKERDWGNHNRMDGNRR